MIYNDSKNQMLLNVSKETENKNGHMNKMVT